MKETKRKKREDTREHCIFYRMHQMNTSGRSIRTPHISMAPDSVPRSRYNLRDIAVFVSDFDLTESRKIAGWYHPIGLASAKTRRSFFWTPKEAGQRSSSR